MGMLDWIVLITSLVFIVVYGVWKGRGSKDITGYFLANRSMRWYTILLSIMATQASAITFLSAPGQAYVDGMRFVQFYFGLPLAMIIPPAPPSPPAGPPNGSHFSRLPAMMPSPPLPEAILICTLSKNCIECLYTKKKCLYCTYLLPIYQ